MAISLRTTILISILLILLIGFGTFGYAKLRDSASLSAAESYVEALIAYKKAKGVYPKTLDELAVSISNNVLGFLPSNNINYETTDNEFLIYYVHFPFGPGSVYSSKEGGWSYEEI